MRRHGGGRRAENQLWLGTQPCQLDVCMACVHVRMVGLLSLHVGVDCALDYVPLTNESVCA